MNPMETKIGVWLDRNEAWLASPVTGDVVKIEAKIDPYHKSTGGGIHKIIRGLAGQINDKAQKRRHEQQKRYFLEQLGSRLIGAQKIYIIGPAETKKELANYLAGESSFRDKYITWETADIMTEAQLVARVREHFKTNVPPRSFDY